MADLLLNYMTLAAGGIIFIAAGIALLAGRNKLSDRVKIVLLIIVDILIIYFIFILLAVVSSGSTNHSEPEAVPDSNIVSGAETGDENTDEENADYENTEYENSDYETTGDSSEYELDSAGDLYTSEDQYGAETNDSGMSREYQ